MNDRLIETMALMANPSPLNANPNRKLVRRFHSFLDHLRQSKYDPDDPLQFIGYLVAMAPESKGQLFQDLWALWVSGQKKGGYFVEFGAASGVYLSNTWLLEKKMGWSGILAEPNPVFFRSLRNNRSCQVSTKCVYPSTGEQLEFIGAKSPEFSRIASIVPEDANESARVDGDRFQVESISLNDLLIQAAAPPIIDFMSVDTEGSELEILSAFDFDRWDVRAITVEHNLTSKREGLYDLLTARGYERQLPDLSQGDDWYVKAA